MKMTLSPRMKDALQAHTVTPTGEVLVWCNHRATAKALIARGATQVSHKQVSLNLTLSIQAARLVSEFVGTFDGQHELKRIRQHLDTYGCIESGYSGQRDAILWTLVRRGRLSAERATVSGWGTSLDGWKFTRPTQPEHGQDELEDMLAREEQQEQQRQHAAQAKQPTCTPTNKVTPMKMTLNDHVRSMLDHQAQHITSTLTEDQRARWESMLDNLCEMVDEFDDVADVIHEFSDLLDQWEVDPPLCADELAHQLHKESGYRWRDLRHDEGWECRLAGWTLTIWYDTEDSMDEWTWCWTITDQDGDDHDSAPLTSLNDLASALAAFTHLTDTTCPK